MKWLKTRAQREVDRVAEVDRWPSGACERAEHEARRGARDELTRGGPPRPAWDE